MRTLLFTIEYPPFKGGVANYYGNLMKKFLESSSGGESVKTLKSKLMAEKLHVVNPGIEPLITRNQETITQIENKYELKNKTVLFSIGRLVKRKGVDMAIKAMSEVLRVVPNLYYVIAGTGPDEKYLKKLTNNNKNIIFIGSPNDTEKWAWMEKCDIFIQLSRKIVDDFEGFGIVYLEAALYGKPVIAGDSGGVSDAVLGGTTGILVNPEKIDRIASAIIRLATDKETAKKLGEQGRKRAMEEFNWQGQAKKIHDIISL